MEWQVLQEVFSIEWSGMFRNLLLMLIAYLLAFPTGLDREMRDEGQFGLRTLPLAAVVSCGFALVGLSVLDSSEAEARVLQGIITGVGFLGGGAILKNDDRVAGTATAASIWNMGAIGIAVAYQRLEIAIALAVLNFITLRFAGRIKRRLRGSQP